MNITTLKSELEGILHGTTLNKVENINGVFNRAARKFLLDIDPQETKRVVSMTNPVFDQIYDYDCPADLKGNKIIDIRPTVNRTAMDRFAQFYSQNFDISKSYIRTPNFNVRFNTGIKTLRVNSAYTINSALAINSASIITGNGTWAVDGVVATNLRQDNLNYAAYGSSLEMDMVGGTAGYIENSTMAGADVTNYENVSSLFLYVYLPTASNFTSINLRWGKDSSNYWNLTVTSTQIGTAFQNGWNLLQFDWSIATKVGNPTASINYSRVTFNYNGTANYGVRINNLICNLGKIYEIEYYSKYLFRDNSTGAFQETVTDDSNLINLDTETYNVFFNLVVLYAVQQSLGEDATFDTTFYQNEYNVGVKMYRALYKSEVQKPTESYYDIPDQSYNQYINRGYSR